MTYKKLLESHRSENMISYNLFIQVCKCYGSMTKILDFGFQVTLTPLVFCDRRL